MKTRDYFFDLPEELIAQTPPAVRGTSRLFVLNRKEETFRHRIVPDLPALIPPGTLVVLNNSRVRKARFFAHALASGGKVEFLFLEETVPGLWSVMVSKARKQKPGKEYIFPGNVRGRIEGINGELRTISLDPPPDEKWFDTYGHIPLPPYIKREDSRADSDRYQNVYSDEVGSAAAPTAGLHLTEDLLRQLTARGCEVAYVTLHVGLGTFLPIRTENVEEHQMHTETYEISPSAAEAVNRARREGRKVMAVGTTVVRTLESAFCDGELKAGRGATGIYIYPGYRFKVVDHLMTNFHTPGSTLLVLVSSFASRDLIHRAYSEAVKERYRFFSYGDSMLIL